MRIFIGDQYFSGEAIQILTAMKREAEGVEDLDLSEYIDWIVENSMSVAGVQLKVDDGTLRWRADSLLNELLNEGLASLVLDAVCDSERTTATFPAAMPQEA